MIGWRAWVGRINGFWFFWQKLSIFFCRYLFTCILLKNVLSHYFLLLNNVWFPLRLYSEIFSIIRYFSNKLFRSVVMFAVTFVLLLFYILHELKHSWFYNQAIATCLKKELNYKYCYSNKIKLSQGKQISLAKYCVNISLKQVVIYKNISSYSY